MRNNIFVGLSKNEFNLMSWRQLLIPHLRAGKYNLGQTTIMIESMFTETFLWCDQTGSLLEY